MVQHDRQAHVSAAARESPTTTAARNLLGHAHYARDVGLPCSHGSHIHDRVIRAQCHSIRGSVDKLCVHVLD